MFKRFFRLAFAIIILSFLCTACDINPANMQITQNVSPINCLTLTYDVPADRGFPPQGMTAKAGSSITVNWNLSKPSIGPHLHSMPGAPKSMLVTSSPVQLSPNQQATMQEFLYGPFPSVAALRYLTDLINHLHSGGPNVPSGSRGTALASSKLIVANGCQTRSFTSSITLPKMLKPAYYDLFITGSTASAGGASNMGGNVPIHVLP